MPLSDLAIRRAKPQEKPYRIYDSMGLYIEIKPSGGKLWHYKYRFSGKEKRLALGRYPDVPLQEARRRLGLARQKLAEGVDPSAVKKATKAANRELAENFFEIVAREWFENWRQDKAESHVKKVISQLERDTFPFIGDIPVAELST
jgi:hypothetical protein